jgi:hypothetical protein
MSRAIDVDCVMNTKQIYFKRKYTLWAGKRPWEN